VGPFIAADDPAYTVGHVSTDRLKRMLSLSILLPSAVRWAFCMIEPITDFLSSLFASRWLLSANALDWMMSAALSTGLIKAAEPCSLSAVEWGL